VSLLLMHLDMGKQPEQASERSMGIQVKVLEVATILQQKSRE